MAQQEANASVQPGAHGVIQAQTKKTRKMPPRGVILAAGALTAVGTSAIYMWSIFNKPLMDTFGYTTSEVSMVYSLFLLASCFSSMIAGWLQHKVQPRFIVLAAGVLFGVGWIGSGFATSLPLLYFFFSLCAGAGNGFLYNTIVAIVTKWYPDKRGLANGVCIGAIGLGPVFFAPLGNFLIESLDVQMAFRVVGIIWIVIYLIFSWLLYVPPANWAPKGWRAEVADAGDATGAAAPSPTQIAEDEVVDDTVAIREVNFTAKQMFKQPLYYVLFFILMVASTSGLMVTGHASNIGQEMAHLTASEGAIMVSVLAFGSFLGRLCFGAISDKIGRYNTLIIALLLNAVVMLGFMAQAHTFVTFLIAVSLVGASFGGTMSVVPAIVGDEFGSANFGQNYSFVYPGYTVASFVGPMAAASAVEAVGSYVPSFYIAGGIALVGIVLVLIGKRLAKKLAAQNLENLENRA